ncbi:photosystem II 44 kDa protein [Iris pallida]|uniref:Photosystem II 44 kDa protein (Chloroplast) n=1 Tax=Iris pallida TaxID=29817 RepID=A0AAX6EQK3_IRIPA|nr:photosystem II 44 kDa protein [Iris pallida]
MKDNSSGQINNKKKFIQQAKGERGIRTLDSFLFRTIPVFKTGAINHSAISPRGNPYFIPTNRTWPYDTLIFYRK